MQLNFLSIFILLVIFSVPAEDTGELLTLNDFEKQALTEGYGAISENLKLESIKWQMRNAAAGYMPSIDYSLNFTKLDAETVDESNLIIESIETLLGINIPDGPNTYYENSFTHKFTLSQPITNGGAEIVAIKLAKEMKQATIYQAKAALNQICYDARVAYLKTVLAYEKLKVAEEELEWVKKNLKTEEVKFNGADSPITDLLTWQSNLAKKGSELLEAKTAYNISLQNMLAMVGDYGEKIDNSSMKLLPFSNFEKLFPDKPLTTKLGLENNPTVLALSKFTKIAHQKKKIAITPFLPRINGFASYEWLPGENFIPKKTTRTWAVGAVLNLSLFSGFRNGTNLKREEFEYQKSIINEKNSISQLKLNLNRINLYLKTSHASTLAMKKSMELMKKNLDIMQIRYDSGLVSQKQLFEVSIGYKKSRLGYMYKLLDYLILESEYYLAIGNIKEIM